MTIEQQVAHFVAMGGVILLAAAFLLWTKKAPEPKIVTTEPLELKASGHAENPRENETKIEHVITERDGQRKEYWYVYIYVKRPGWYLRSAHTDAEGAIWQKKWSDDLYFGDEKTTVILRETLP